MRIAARVVLGGALMVCPALAYAFQAVTPVVDVSTSKQPEVSFQFDRTGVDVPHYTLRLREDGAGNYQADQAEVPAKGSAMRGQAAEHIDRSINLTSATVSKVFKGARALDHFNIDCASKAKNIADTGTKTLSYTGPDGHGSCTYNYSENKTVGALTDAFLAIAFTLDEGRRLAFLHRYDRLGLDAEMTSFAQEVEAGRAIELGMIAPTLAAIVDDTAVIQRVRLRAQRMLEQVAAEGH